MDLKHYQDEYLKCAIDPVYYLNNYGYVFDAKKQRVDKMTCFEYQEECIMKYHNYRNNIILKSRQCLPIGTYIKGVNGKTKIENIKRGDKIYSFNLERKKIEEDIITDVWCSGKRECLKIYLEDGIIVESGENHPFYSIEEKFIRAIDLKIGVKILNINKGYKEIVFIENIGEKNCYDISVEKNENFILENGLLVHNTGLSVITAGYVAWRLIFRKDERILIIANDGAGAVRFLTTVKQFLEFTPNWLLPKNGERVTDNQKEIKLANGSQAVAKASSPNAGRGDSLTLLVLDETAFIDYAQEIWMAAGMALSATQGKCIMLSTPAGTGNLYHNIWTEADKSDNKMKDDDFVPTRVHWTQNPYSAEGLEVREDLEGEKVYWSPWYEGECKRMQYDKVKIAQELDLSFEGSKYLAIDNDLIAKYEKRMLLDEYKDIDKNKIYYDYRAEPLKRFVTHETTFHVFKKYKEGHKYLITNDVARGDGKDFSTSHVIDIDTLEVVAEYRDKISPDLFAHVIYNIAMDYGEAYVVVEANSFGLGTGYDLNRKMGYTRMYFSKSIQDIYVRPYDFKVSLDETIPGFQTTKKTRPLIISNLISHMREGALKIYSKRLMGEFKTFVQNGERSEAEKGKNDDLIMALAIGLFIRDTEYTNAAASKEMYKGMLDAIGFSSTSISGEEFNSIKPSENVSDVPPDAGGIFFSANRGEFNDDDDNDTSWLIG